MKPRYSILVLAAVLFTTLGATAMSNISEVVGPYKISFSLPDDIDVAVNKTTEDTESFYGVRYTNYLLRLEDSLNLDNIALIAVAQFEKSDRDLILEDSGLIEVMKNLGYTDVSSYNREIDGSPGFLAVGTTKFFLSNGYAFTYHLDEQTRVLVISTLPWDDGTSMMLRTLHVEKVE